ncbi:DUF7151 family protein [Pseudobacteriovorax antillogorgiicola]|uniref:DUF7151 domain-containing protein n=1 Tax=Pseudobacteriovorax antillogorgiicola TaxID=1513793 RepID=A0A1Y6CM89_9BACT|nr:hypothetical protein [Pseudobacteriovorax antillogorgiicola]TCS47332.1 hypothetical protein EDD56_121107 [Pseudobacteriovorax antillogorgiicola]SMF63063.1 hypothetical protein SAMN06296036_121107 [Pseudobacteriovorax antillogorgiicola]
MKRLLILVSIIGSLSACRASFQSTDESSALSAEAVPEEEGKGTEDLGSGGPDEFPTLPDDKGVIDDDGSNDNDGVKITITIPFGPGEDDNCPYGGEKTIVGIDKNGDGQISEDEVIEVSYECLDKPKDDKNCCCCCCYWTDGKASTSSSSDNKTCCCAESGYSASGSKSGDDTAKCCYCCDDKGSYTAQGGDDKAYQCCDCCKSGYTTSGSHSGDKPNCCCCCCKDHSYSTSGSHDNPSQSDGCQCSCPK